MKDISGSHGMIIEDSGVSGYFIFLRAEIRITEESNSHWYVVNGPNSSKETQNLTTAVRWYNELVEGKAND